MNIANDATHILIRQMVDVLRGTREGPLLPLGSDRPRLMKIFCFIFPNGEELLEIISIKPGESLDLVKEASLGTRIYEGVKKYVESD